MPTRSSSATSATPAPRAPVLAAAVSSLCGILTTALSCSLTTRHDSRAVDFNPHPCRYRVSAHLLLVAGRQAPAPLPAHRRPPRARTWIGGLLLHFLSLADRQRTGEQWLSLYRVCARRLSGGGPPLPD